MSEESPRPKRPLEKVFWVALFLPIGLILLMVPLGRSNSDLIFIPLVSLLLAVLVCPLYCGVRLAMLWTRSVVAQVFLSLALAAGLGVLYLSVALAGCGALM